MLKASFHIHVRGDKDDYIRYTGFELLDHAKALGFDVIAFPCHERVVITEALKAHAKKLDILLIPGIELNLGGHVLVLNASPDAQNLKTTEDLKKYRATHPEIFTIAAHPFFPERKYCFQERIYNHLDLFDGIELSWFYSQWIDWNKKAKQLSEKEMLPYIATSDVHRLDMLDNGHVLIDANKNVESIFQALKENKFKSIAKPQGVIEMWWRFAKMQWSLFERYFPWTPPHLIFEHENLPATHQGKSRRGTKKNRLSGRN